MQRWLLKSKLHRGCVTATEKDYEGSIAIDAELLSAADILPGERVQVLDIANGARFETYTIEGEPGQIAVNGAAARLVEPGDRVIVVSYGLYDEDERPEPTVLLLDAENQITRRGVATVSAVERTVSSPVPPRGHSDEDDEAAEEEQGAGRHPANQVD